MCNNPNVEQFDPIFYKHLYPDLAKNGLIKSTQLFNHWKTHGKIEGRVGTRSEMNNRYEKNMQKIKSEYREYMQTYTTNIVDCIKPLITILIRTSSRPHFFNKCIESVLAQSYSNYKIVVGYDTDDSLDYLRKYEHNSNIQIICVKLQCTKKFKFNLYCNKLIAQVTEGYVMFLDDDDELSHPHAINIIGDTIEQTQSDIIIWSFMRPDKLIFPDNIDDIKLGSIDTTSCCYRRDVVGDCVWKGERYAEDFYFYKELFRHKNITKIDNIITKVQMIDKIGHFGGH